MGTNMRRMLAAAAPVFLVAFTAHAGEPASARVFSPVGTVLERGDKPGVWLLPQLYDSVPENRELVTLPGARGALEVKEGDLRLSLLRNLPELSTSPVLESAVVFHRPRDADVELTLDRGRLLVECKKEKGSVKARFRFPDSPLVVDLEPAATIALERHSGWRPGVPFAKKPPPGHEPETEV